MRFVSCPSAVVTLTLACTAPGALAVPFDVTFAGDVPAQARTAFSFAAEKWAEVLPQSFTHQEVDVHVDFAAITSVANTSGAFYLPNDVTSLSPLRRFRRGFLYPDALVEYIHGGEFGQLTDFTIQFNQSLSWFYGTDGAPADDSLDFVTVALHEIAHGLGLNSFIREDGSFAAFPTIYDALLCDIPCTSLVYAMTPEERRATITSGDLQWIGSFGLYGHGFDGYSGPLELHAPPTFIRGTSVAHLDPVKYPNELMRPGIALGQSTHNIGNVTFGMLEDIGWRRIPEPSTWSLLGIALLALALSHLRLCGIHPAAGAASRRNPHRRCPRLPDVPIPVSLLAINAALARSRQGAGA